ncbi:hypothetical protein MS3_00001800 [Schistosoma haematobium]|uniref:ERAP1-like C-terminal domain-containing protein n=1 Tax=Schistosoma haematobium TaxID=6185 RepID=A0A922S6I0_SCHHA|nr:hypothetical protein MS3_00001800 [Schistosoma haematobium]KAH9595936.1 hypothetical protein MS3_00001800 [Schistosoma haematobium]
MYSANTSHFSDQLCLLIVLSKFIRGTDCLKFHFNRMKVMFLSTFLLFYSIRPDLRFITYCTAIRHGGHVEWKFLEGQLTLNDSVNEEDTENKMLALTCSRDTEIMKEYLRRVRENKNFWFTLDYFSESPIGNQLLWDHLNDVDNFVEHK